MISSVNQLLKIVFEGLAKVLPTSFKNRLKRNNSLLAFYDRTIQLRGLFSGYVPQKELDKSYQSVFEQQQLSLNQLPDKQVVTFDLVILVAIHKVESLHKSLADLPSDLAVHIVCRQNDIDDVNRLIENYKDIGIKVYPSPVAQLNTSNSVFFIQAGQLIHEQLGKALFHWSDKNDVLYTDKDHVINGQHQNPIFLPDWNPDFQLSAAYIRTGIWFNDQDDIPSIITNHAQTIAEWAAALYLHDTKKHVARIPYSLVHDTESRKFNYQNYANTLSKWQGNEAAVKVNAFIGRLSWKWRHNNPLVSVIIPFCSEHKRLKKCIKSIRKSSYSRLQIILVADESIDLESASWLQQLKAEKKVKIIEFGSSFDRPEMINLASEQADGEIIGLIDPDIEAKNAKWLNNIVSNVVRSDIGCVGAKLLYSDGRVKHAGLVMGSGGNVHHAYKHYPQRHLGYIKRLVVTQNYSALDGACLFVKKADFKGVGGLNERNYGNTLTFTDLCLRMMTLGKRNLLCANAKLYHHLNARRDADSTTANEQSTSNQRRLLESQWQPIFDDDPAYNPNLSLENEYVAPRTEAEIKTLTLQPR